MKKGSYVLCLLLVIGLLFSACTEDTIDIHFVANKDIKKIFDKVHTVNYILDDIRKVDFYQKMTIDDTFTEETDKDGENNTSITRYYQNEELVFVKYSGNGIDAFDYYTVSSHSNDLVIHYENKNKKRASVIVNCTDDNGSYSVCFEKGLDKASPYGANQFTVWIKPRSENTTFKSEAYYDVEYKDGITTCTLTSAKYYDKDGTFKHFSHTTNDAGVTEESNEPLYNMAENTESIIGDSVDIIRHMQQLDSIKDCEILMGPHAFSYAKNEEGTDWYINSKISFTFSSKKKAAAFSARYGGNGVKEIKNEEAKYAVDFDSCNLKIAPDCKFPDLSFGEFAAAQWENSRYYRITLNENAEITAFEDDAILTAD